MANLKVPTRTLTSNFSLQDYIDDFTAINTELVGDTNKIGDLSGFTNIGDELRKVNTSLNDVVQDQNEKTQQISNINSSLYLLELKDEENSKITDSEKLSYDIPLTLNSTDYVAYDTSLYGQPNVSVRNGTASLNLTLNKLTASINENIVTQMPAEILPSRRISSPANSFNAGYTKIAPQVAVLQHNGIFKLDRYAHATNSDCNNYISININYPIDYYRMKGIFKNYVDDLISQLKQIIGDKPCFVLATDMHANFTRVYNSDSMSCFDTTAIQTMNYITDKLGADFQLFIGDNLNDVSGKSVMLDNYRYLRRIAIDRTLFIRGNHDDNSQLSQVSGSPLKSEVVTIGEAYDLLLKGKKGFSINDAEPNGMYYFYDDEKNKIRYIMLNTCDIPYIDKVGDSTRYKYAGVFSAAFREKQLKWLAGKALNFDKKVGEWQVIINGHHPILEAAEGLDGLDVAPTNRDVVHTIINAFNNKTTVNVSGGSGDFAYAGVSSDFTKQKGKIIAYLFGHYHYDYSYKKNNVWHIGFESLYPSPKFTTDNAIYGRYDFDRVENTSSEYAYNVVILDKANSKIVIKRLGAGNNREFVY